MLVCPDYVLCSEDVIDAFIQECRVVSVARVLTYTEHES